LEEDKIKPPTFLPLKGGGLRRGLLEENKIDTRWKIIDE